MRFYMQPVHKVTSTPFDLELLLSLLSTSGVHSLGYQSTVTVSCVHWPAFPSWEQWGRVVRMKKMFSNLVPENSEVGHSPIRVSKQNMDEGRGGNFQVRFQMKPLKTFPKVLGDYDPSHCCWRSKKCIWRINYLRWIRMGNSTSFKIFLSFQKRLFIWKTTNFVPCLIFKYSRICFL